MKKIVLIGLLVMMVSLCGYGEGLPVIDITNILTSIENGYTMVEQLQAMYNNIKTSYDQLQQTIKSFEAFDISELDARDPLGSWRSIMTYADRMMTYEENMERILNRRDLKIGNQSWSLADVFTSNPIDTFGGMAGSGVNFVAVDPFERRLTPEEKAMYHQKYGMSYGHYMRYDTIGNMLQEKATEVIGYTKALKENATQDREVLSNIVSEGIVSESTVQQQQTMNAILGQQAQSAITQAELLAQMSEMMAMDAAKRRQQEEEVKALNSLGERGLSEGFLDMTNDMNDENYW